MIRLTLTVSMAALALSGCGRPAEPARPSAKTVGTPSAAQAEFCKRGGMAAANDASCKAAADARFEKFMKGGGGDEHGRR